MLDQLQLPKVQSPLKSARISSFDEYRRWQQQKKQAYRAELDQQVMEHSRSKEANQKMKIKERQDMLSMVQDQQKHMQQDKFVKAKTQQKYMIQNYQLIKETAKTPLKHHHPETVYKEHPFIKLINEEDNRKKQTKNHFIYQNKCNEAQQEIRLEQKKRRKVYESEERQRYVDHVQEEYHKQQIDRDAFQKKYLKINKQSTQNCKKQYLQYLKEQAAAQKGVKRRTITLQKSQVTRASPGNIGMSPFSYDRQKQLQKIERSLKLFSVPKDPRLRSSFQSERQYDISLNNSISKRMQRSIDQKSKYQKVVTERAQIDPNPIQYNMKQPKQSNIINMLSHEPIISQISQKLDKPKRPRRQFKQYDIINGSDRIFIN